MIEGRSTSVSAIFCHSVTNTVVLVSVYRTFTAVGGERLVEDDSAHCPSAAFWGACYDRCSASSDKL